MKAKVNISLLFSIVVLCEIYIVSFRINLLIQFAFLLLLVVSGKTSFTKSFIKTILPIIVIFFIGFIGSLINNYLLVNIIKDISHFIKPIFVLTLGYLTFKKVNNEVSFLKTIIGIASVTSIIHLTGVFFFSNVGSNSIQSIRGDFGLDNFIEIYALYFLILAPKNNIVIFKNRFFSKILIIVLSLSILFYFSRTMFGMIIIIGFSMYGYAKFNAKSFRIISVLALVVLLFFGYLNSIKLDRNSKGLESFFYKIKIAPGEVFNAKVNREDHRKLWDHWRAYEAKRALNLMNDKPVSYLFGTGYGSLVNLKFKAPLGDGNGMRYISVLHNGYIFVLYKSGIIGILLYLFFLVSLYKRVYVEDRNTFFKIVISTIGIYFLFTSIIITGIYIPKDSILFILGGALYHENKT